MAAAPRTPRFRLPWAVLAALVLFAGGPSPASAQKPAPAGKAAPATPAGPDQGEKAAPPPKPKDPFGRETPRSSVEGFLAACRKGDYIRAAAYLDPGLAAGPLGQALLPNQAWQLQVVLDRKLLIEPAKINDDPQGAPGDGLPAALERIGAIPLPQGEVDVFLSRGPGPKGVPIWRFAPTTVARIPELYREYGYGWLGKVLPGYFFEIRFLQMELWQWLGLIVLVVATALLGFLATAFGVRVARAFVKRTKTTWDDLLLNMVAGPLRLGTTVLFFYLASFLLALSVPAENAVAALCKVVAILAFAWMALRGVDIFGTILQGRFQHKDPAAANTLVPMGRKLTKVFVLLVALVALLQELGFNIAGLVAGLGVGGIAVALAAQKTIENFFGGITVIADRPVKVGDFCRVGDKVGTVEDIGLRSTRIRTLDRTILTIPNAQFSTSRLENFGKRDRILLSTTIGVGYETTPDQIRWLLREIRKMMFEHPKTDKDPCRIRFVNFGSSSLDLEIFVYIRTRDWGEFLSIREDLFLRIMDIVHASGTYFAFPSQTLYLGRDSGRDEDRSTRCEAEIRTLREKGELQIP